MNTPSTCSFWGAMPSDPLLSFFSKFGLTTQKILPTALVNYYNIALQGWIQESKEQLQPTIDSNGSENVTVTLLFYLE